MSELVQVAVAGSVDEAEELQPLLTRAGIEATLEGAVDEHPGRTETSRCACSWPRTSSMLPVTPSRRSPSRTISSQADARHDLQAGAKAIVVEPA